MQQNVKTIVPTYRVSSRLCAANNCSVRSLGSESAI